PWRGFQGAYAASMSSDSGPPSGLRPPWKPGALSLTTLLLSVLMAAVFAAVYGWMLWRKEAQYQTYAYDLGLFTQVAWNTLHGHPFATTLLAFNYLADHFAPSLALVAPLFLFWPDARALLLVQAAAMAAAGIGIFLATWQRTGDGRSALLIQLAYHLAPVTAWVALDEFHP